MSKIKAIFFDADFTLFKFSKSVGALYAEQVARSGVQICAKSVDEIMGQVIEDVRRLLFIEVEDPLKTSEEEFDKLWRQVFFTTMERIGAEVPDESYDHVFSAFARGESRLVYPETREVLAELREREFKLGVLSNNDARLYSILDELELTSSFDYLFTSSELGYLKPSLQCFRRVEERTGHSSDEILMIGDNPKDDYAGANGAGWRALLYNPDNKRVDCELRSIVSHREILEEV